MAEIEVKHYYRTSLPATWVVGAYYVIETGGTTTYYIVRADGTPMLINETEFNKKVDKDPTAVSADTLTNDSVFQFWKSAIKKITWENIKATLKTYFDTLYQAIDNYLTLDQTTPQEIINGIPKLETTRSYTGDIHELVDVKKLDESVTALNQRFYMTDNDSAIAEPVEADLYKFTCQTCPVGAFSNAYAGLADNDYIVGYISPDGAEIPKLLAGIYQWNAFIARTAGTKSLRVYWKLYKREISTGTETLLATSATSDLITDKRLVQVPLLLTADVVVGTGFDIVGKLYATVGTSGSAPTATLYGGGTDNSHWAVPTNIEVLDNIYLQLNQATPQTISGGQPIQDILTASELVATDASKKLQSLAVATYPSLTELSYVKGLTSAIQTQINNKLSLNQATPQTLTASPIVDTLTAGRVPFANATKQLVDDGALFWDNTNKRLGIGTTTPITSIAISSATEQTQISAIYTGTSATAGAFAGLLKLIGSALGSGDRIGGFNFIGSRSATLTSVGAVVTAYTDGAWSTTSAPTMIQFEVMPVNKTAGIDRIKALTIKSDGKVGIMNETPTEELDITGNIKATGYKTGAETGQTTTLTQVTDVRMNAGQMQKKTRTDTYTNGLLTEKGVESDWTNTTDI